VVPLAHRVAAGNTSDDATHIGTLGRPVTGFRELKVPDDVLRDAGFDVPTVSRRGRSAQPRAGRPRAKAVSVEEIKAYVLAQPSAFLLADITSGVGGSQATIRKAIGELIDAGQVNKLGPVPGYTGRGRAPIRYSKT
jgi:hypothetical protein